MHGYYYEFQDTGTVYYCITADQMLSFFFIVGWFCFLDLPPPFNPKNFNFFAFFHFRFTYFDLLRFISYCVASDFYCFVSIQNNRKTHFLFFIAKRGTFTFCRVSNEIERRTLFGKPEKMMHGPQKQRQLKRDRVKT
jgi:hypothetical protein